MANWLILLIVGIVALVVAYYATLPPPIKTILNIVGWICVLVGVVLLVVGLTGIG